MSPLDAKGYSLAPAGAVVYMVAAPGLTREWLGHLIECYRAEIETAGSQPHAAETCPLAEPGTSYSVASTGDGFAVAMRADRHDVASRLFEASERLAPSNSSRLEAVAVRP